MDTLQYLNARALKPRRGRLAWALFGLACGALLAVCAAPRTRWIVARSLSGPLVHYYQFNVNESTEASPERIKAQARFGEEREATAAAAARFPDDPAAQAVAAKLRTAAPLYLDWQPEETTREVRASHDLQAASELDSVAARFPASPLPRAALLREYCERLVGVDRPEDEWLAAAAPAPPSEFSDRNEGVYLDWFVRAAREGERLDPRNAFFPMMEAVARFARRQDEAALTAVVRASRLPDWNDYSYEEMTAHARLLRAALGPQSVTGAAANLWPSFLHLSQWRAVGRMVRVHAALQERAGRPKQGLALRAALSRVGVTMRDHSRSAIGASVGTGLLVTAAGRTDPREAAKWANRPGRERADHEREVYLHLLRRNGLSAEANWYRYQRDLSEETRRAIDGYQYEQPRWKMLTALWAGGQAALAEAVLFGVTALASGGVLYRSRFRMTRPGPLPRPVARGAWAGLLAAAVLLGIMGVRLSQMGVAEFPALNSLFLYGNLILGVVLTAIPLLACVVVRDFRPWLIPALAAFWLTVGVADLAAFLAVSVVSLAGPESGLSLVGAAEDGYAGWDARIQTGALALLAPPLLLCVGLAVWNRARRVPFAHGLARGFHAVALPLTALLLIGFAASTVVLAHEETAATRDAYAQAADEVRWMRDHPAAAEPDSSETP